MYKSESYDLTDKQRPFFEWVMGTLGFVDDELTSLYILRLKSTAFRYRFSRKIPASVFKQIYTKDDRLNYDRQIQELKGYGFSTFKKEGDPSIDGNISHALQLLYQPFGKYCIPRYYKILDFLSDELRIKQRNLIFRVQNPNLNSISATDLANYSYCPVAYVISKTFEQERILAAEIGSLLHEQTVLKSLLFKLGRRLQGIVIDTNYQRTINDAFTVPLVNDSNGYFFKDIAEAELIYVGHAQDRKYFRNREMNFIGMPDYVYRQRNGKYFFVEEKFILMRDNSGTPPFYANHVNQLDAYVSLINEIDVIYGYLVYWLYTFEYGMPIVKRCVVRRDDRTDTLASNVLRIKNELEKVKNGGVQRFVRNPERMTKCAGCVYNRICGHKTGLYDSYSFPYDTTFLQTYNVPYNTNMETYFNNMLGLKDDLPF